MIDKIKFEIELIFGDVLIELVLSDLEFGDGVEVILGVIVDVYYVGVDFEIGEEFDLSWSCGELIQFLLNGFICGWQEGIFGMRVGGWCQFICLLVYVYGFVGGGYWLFGCMFVFVIDLLVVC